MTNKKETKNEVQENLKQKELLAKLKGYYDTCVQYYTKEHKKMKLLDATDRGDLWKAIGAKFPKYHILKITYYLLYTQLLKELVLLQQVKKISNWLWI